MIGCVCMLELSRGRHRGYVLVSGRLGGINMHAPGGEGSRLIL